MTWSIIALLLACGDKDVGDTGAVATTDGGTEELQPVAGDLDGEWLVGLTIAPVGNIVINFQADIEDVVLGDTRTITRMTLRASDGEEVSDILGEVTEIEVAGDGTFTAEFPVLTLPGEYSPTSGEVDVQPTMTVSAASADSFCGDLTGEIVTFGIDLTGSSFGAVPWEARADGVIASCSTEAPEELPRMEAADCPELVAGTNSGFPSGQVARSFELVLPSAYDAGTDWPIVFAFHGLGGAGEGLLSYGLRVMADDAGAILVVPDASELGGSIAWDAVSDELSNIDLLLFDDLLTCTSAALSVDPDRIYATGMSNGGLMTGKLLALRGDVLAAAAPLSGGVLGTWPDSPTPPPTLVVWGGEDDWAVDQDFHSYALAMLEELGEREVFRVQCDHGTGHTLDASYWPWVFDFLLDHPATVHGEPYAKGLPDSFPDYCELAD